MVQNKKMGAGLALVAALFGMGVSGTASALPEMQVDTMMVSVGTVAPSADSVDDSATDPDDGDTEETGS